MTIPIYAWHWLRDDRTLAEGPHARTYKVEPGVVYWVPDNKPLELCDYGLHASECPLDALQYAPGGTISRVRLWGHVERGRDKLCAYERETLWLADATTALHEFACWCTERALKRERKAGREPDERSWNAIRVKRAWLRGEATDEDLAAARAAALAAARDAARDAAWDAAWAAARRGAAWDAERKVQSRKLTRMLEALPREEA